MKHNLKKVGIFDQKIIEVAILIRLTIKISSFKEVKKSNKETNNANTSRNSIKCFSERFSLT